MSSKHKSSAKNSGEDANSGDSKKASKSRSPAHHPGAASLGGIHKLLNAQNMRQDVNPEEIERGLAGVHAKSRDGDPAQKYAEELTALQTELDSYIDDKNEGDTGGKTPVAAAVATPRHNNSSLDELERLAARDDFSVAAGLAVPEVASSDGTDSTEGEARPRERNRRSSDYETSSEGSGSSGSSSGSASGSGSDSSSESGSSASESGSSSSGEKARPEHKRSKNSAVPANDEDRLLDETARLLGIKTPKPRARPQQRGGRETRHKINARSRKHHSRSKDEHGNDSNGDEVEHDDSRSRVAAALERMRAEDGEVKNAAPSPAVSRETKMSKLNFIAQMVTNLKESGTDIKDIVLPTMESTDAEISDAMAILRIRCDNERNSTFGEESILAASQFVESVFDGSFEIPLVGWRPDYTGYSSTVSVKLNRMRHETGQMVHHIMEKYKPGTVSRLLMEFLPSFVMYPRMTAGRRGEPGLGDVLRGAKSGSGGSVADDSRALDEV